MIENDRYNRRYINDVMAGYVALRTGFTKKAILDSFF